MEDPDSQPIPAYSFDAPRDSNLFDLPGDSNAFDLPGDSNSFQPPRDSNYFDPPESSDSQPIPTSSFDAPEESDIARTSVIQDPEPTPAYQADYPEDFHPHNNITNEDVPVDTDYNETRNSALHTYYDPDQFDNLPNNESVEEPPSSPFIPPYEGPPDPEPLLADPEARHSLPPQPDSDFNPTIVAIDTEEPDVQESQSYDQVDPTLGYQQMNEENREEHDYNRVVVTQTEETTVRESQGFEQDPGNGYQAVAEEEQLTQLYENTSAGYVQTENVPDPPKSPPPEYDRFSGAYDNPVTVSTENVNEFEQVPENEIQIQGTIPPASEPVVVDLTANNNTDKDITWAAETQAPGHSLASYSYTTNPDNIEMVEIVPGTQANGRTIDAVKTFPPGEDPDFFFKAKSPTNMDTYFAFACVGLLLNILFGGIALHLVQKGRDSDTPQRARRYGGLAVFVAIFGILVTVAIILAVGFTTKPEPWTV